MTLLDKPKPFTQCVRDESRNWFDDKCWAIDDWFRKIPETNKALIKILGMMLAASLALLAGIEGWFE